MYVCISQVPLKHKVHIHLHVQHVQHVQHDVHGTENGRRGTESKHKLKEKDYHKHKGREEWKNIRLATKHTKLSYNMTIPQCNTMYIVTW